MPRTCSWQPRHTQKSASQSRLIIICTFYLLCGLRVLRLPVTRLRSHLVWSDPGGLPGRVVDPKGPALLIAPVLAPAGMVTDSNTVFMTVVDWVQPRSATSGRGSRGGRGGRGGRGAEVDRSDPGGLLG